ncbi:hypothetical protein [Modicisalibacter luteus]|uniref:hypothetical protein n=1 Tax=Modicisalibacter luteus TaxID=453962 RepID=UPI0036336593
MTAPLTLVATLVAKTGFETELEQALQDLQPPVERNRAASSTTSTVMPSRPAPST